MDPIAIPGGGALIQGAALPLLPPQGRQEILRRLLGGLLADGGGIILLRPGVAGGTQQGPGLAVQGDGTAGASLLVPGVAQGGFYFAALPVQLIGAAVQGPALQLQRGKGAGLLVQVLLGPYPGHLGNALLLHVGEGVAAVSALSAAGGPVVPLALLQLLIQLGQVDQLSGGGVHIVVVAVHRHIAQHRPAGVALIGHIFQLQLQGALQQGGCLVRHVAIGGGVDGLVQIGLVQVVPLVAHHRAVPGVHLHPYAAGGGQAVEQQLGLEAVGSGPHLAALLLGGQLDALRGVEHLVGKGLGIGQGLRPAQGGEGGGAVAVRGVGVALLPPQVVGVDGAVLTGLHPEGLSLLLPVQGPVRVKLVFRQVAVEFDVGVSDVQLLLHRLGHLGHPLVRGIGSRRRQGQSHRQHRRQQGARSPFHRVSSFA